MEKFIGQDIDDLKERELFIKDNADEVENKGYSKPLAGSEIDRLKKQLTDACIKKQDLEEEKKTVVKGYQDEINGQKVIIKDCSEKLKSKSKYVTEPCYKLVDEAEKMVGYYNKEGMLVYERPARLEELQPKLFKMNAGKTGTDDK